jgi:hypothetical protein
MKTPVTILTLSLSALLAGCSVSSQVNPTQRSSIEQRLLVRSLERAMAALDVESFRGKVVAVDFYGLTSDRDFAKEFFTAWLQEKQVRITADPQKAQLRLKVFASALGVDKGRGFLGVPAVTVPILGFSMPEVALFKSVSNRGHAEIQVYTLDAGTGEFIGRSPATTGGAKYDDYTILILVHFNISDIDQNNGCWSFGEC